MNRKVILITGCSSGIGFSAAEFFTAKGWQVLATCRNEADCRRLTDLGFDSFPLDYEDESSIESGFAEALSRSGGRLDVLFNNGAYGIPGAVEDLPTPALRQIFEANFFGWHHLTRLALPVMIAQGSGRIIQNSSVLGFAALRLRGAYIATKFALEGLTDTLRLEFSGTGIDFCLVEPGPIKTPFRANSYLQFKRWIDWRGSRLERLYEGGLIPYISASSPAPARFELSAEAVAAVVYRAAVSRNPKPRYRVTKATTILMLAKRFLTSRGYDRFASRL